VRQKRSQPTSVTAEKCHNRRVSQPKSVTTEECHNRMIVWGSGGKCALYATSVIVGPSCGQRLGLAVGQRVRNLVSTKTFNVLVFISGEDKGPVGREVMDGVYISLS
jgi:hypothetical protein